MASPFRLPTASTFEVLVRLCGPLYDPELQVERLAEPLPVAGDRLVSARLYSPEGAPT